MPSAKSSLKELARGRGVAVSRAGVLASMDCGGASSLVASGFAVGEASNIPEVAPTSAGAALFGS